MATLFKLLSARIMDIVEEIMNTLHTCATYMRMAARARKAIIYLIANKFDLSIHMFRKSPE